VEKIAGTVDFVEDHQAVLVAGKECRRIGKLGAIFGRFEVEVDRGRIRGDGVGQRRFAELTGAGQGDGGLACEGALNGGAGAAGDHPCILSMAWMICKDRGFAGRSVRLICI
jgi:hypothetical protein